MTEEVVEFPLLSKPRVAEVQLVETVTSLREACTKLATMQGAFALDAERASGFKYSQRAYLIQVHRVGSPIYLIDPIAVSEDQQNSHAADSSSAMNELAELLSTDEWILHAASQDIPCLRELGIVPTKIFDTELGSRLAGLPRVGLGAVTETLLHLKLAKEHSAVDWSIRPLKSEWLNYAALDVDVLHELKTELSKLLFEQGKFTWAEEEFANVCRMKAKEPKPDRWRGMSGMHDIKDQRSMAIARELWFARESLAERLDVSPGRLIPDSSIVSVAANPPRTRPELAAAKNFSGRASRSYIDTWWSAINEGSTTRNLPDSRLPQIGIPNHRVWPNRFPEADKRLKFSRAALTKLGEELSIPLENLITPDTVRQICFEAIEPLTVEAVSSKLKDFDARQWQIDLVSTVIFAALSTANLKDNAELAVPEVSATVDSKEDA
jgi:ribonuclease D